MRFIVRAAGRSDVGLHRQTNEDSWVARRVLFAVADGMGGAKAGEVASRVAIETLVDRLPRLAEASDETAGEELIVAAEDANTRIYELSVKHRSQAGMGTTLTAVLLCGESAWLVHIGDSRAYALRDGMLQQLTDDHSLVAEMTRTGELSSDEAAGHPLRSVLSRALGTEAQVEIDLLEIDLRDGDVLLLCTDGLSGVVPHEKLTRLVDDPDPAHAAERLVRAALEEGGPDNVTALVVRLEAEDEAEAAGDDAEAGAKVVAGNDAAAIGNDADAAGEAGWPEEAEATAGDPATAAPAEPVADDPDTAPAEPAVGAEAPVAVGEAPGDPSAESAPDEDAGAESAPDGTAAGRRGGWWRSLWRGRGR